MIFIWGFRGAMLSVSPAPLFGLYRQARLAKQGFLIKALLLLATIVLCIVDVQVTIHLECHKLHAQSQLQCGTVKASEFMHHTSGVSRPYTVRDVTSHYQCNPQPMPHGHNTLVHTICEVEHQPRA